MEKSKKMKKPLKIMLIGTAVKLLGNLTLIPVMGVDGAAVSTSLCYILILILSLGAYRRASDVTPDSLPFLKVLYAGAMCGGTAYLTASAMGRAGITGLTKTAAGVICGGAMYLIVLVLTMGNLRKKECSKLSAVKTE